MNTPDINTFWNAIDERYTPGAITAIDVTADNVAALMDITEEEAEALLEQEGEPGDRPGWYVMKRTIEE